MYYFLYLTSSVTTQGRPITERTLECSLLSLSFCCTTSTRIFFSQKLWQAGFFTSRFYCKQYFLMFRIPVILCLLDAEEQTDQMRAGEEVLSNGSDFLTAVDGEPSSFWDSTRNISPRDVHWLRAWKGYREGMVPDRMVAFPVPAGWSVHIPVEKGLFTGECSDRTRDINFKVKVDLD